MKVLNPLKWLFSIGLILPLTFCGDEQSLNPSSINYPIVAISASNTYNLGEDITFMFRLAEDSHVLVWIQNADLLSDIESYFHHLVSVNYFNFKQPLNNAKIILNIELLAGAHQVNIDSNELGKGIFYIFLVSNGLISKSSFADYKTFQIK